MATKRCPTSHVSMTKAARKRSLGLMNKLKRGAEATERRTKDAEAKESKKAVSEEKKRIKLFPSMPGTSVGRKKVRDVGRPEGLGKGFAPIPMEDLPGTDVDREKVRDKGRKPGLPGKDSLLTRLTEGATKMSPLAKKVATSVLSESGKRAKGFKLSAKSAIASVASMTFLKKILGKLSESSGLLGAVFKILGKVFLMALMPIATAIGMFLLPFTLQILEVVRKMLHALKGPLADLISGKINVAEFFAIAIPIMAEAFGDIGTILGNMIIGFLDLVETVWPMVEPYFIKAFNAIADFIEDRLWPKVEPLMRRAFDVIFKLLEEEGSGIGGRLGKILGKVIGAAMPLILIGILKSLPIIVAFIYTAFVGFIIGILDSMGITFDEFLVGLAVVLASAAVGIAFALAGMPIAIAAAIAAITLGLGAVATKAAYDAGVQFGNFLRLLNEKLGGIPGLVLEAFKLMLNPLGVLKIGPLIYDAIASMLPGGKKTTAPPATGYRDADKAIGGIGGGVPRPVDPDKSDGGLIGRVIGGIGGIIGKIGKILPFAEGGITTAPTLGMLSENHQKEAVMPLDKLKGMTGGSGSYNFTINIDQPQIASNMDLETITREISEQIYENIRRNTAW